LGWSPSGRAIVSFPTGVCADGYRGGPGVYSVDSNGTITSLVLRTNARQQVAFWG
jgi:hypothetical protein